MIPRPDLSDGNAPGEIEVFQFTIEPDVPACHVYMEAQVFTPDSRRLVLHRSATPHGSDKDDPRHQYLLCDLENNGELSSITHELGATGPSISPDGEYLYYFVDQTEVNGGRLTLKRVNLDGTQRQTIMVLDSPLADTTFRPSRIYPLSTIRSDGGCIAISAFLGDGQAEPPPWGLMVFNIESASAELMLHGPTWCNVHPQYCRSTDPESAGDILVQENHGCEVDAQGTVGVPVSEPGADVHVIRDDGTRFRDLPWGRNGIEACQGHQCWRGRSPWAITSTHTTIEGQDRGECQLIESLPVERQGHIGAASSGALRNNLSRRFTQPRFCHFATDIAGRRLVTDQMTDDGRWHLYAAEFGKPGENPLTHTRFLVNTRASLEKQTHTHPFLSPDGTCAFFNSDESGILQAYMIRGLNSLSPS